MKKGIFNLLVFVTGAVTGSTVAGNLLGKKAALQEVMSEKHLSLFLMMNQWVKNYQEGREISSYFERNGYKKIAIYGMSYAGETLLNELKKTEVQVAYVIDKKAGNTLKGLTAYSPEDELEEADAIIVTAIAYFDEIRDLLEEKVTCPIISLESVIYEV